MNKYNIKNWTTEEIDFLKNNCKLYTYPELSNMLNRSRSAIQHKVSQLGLQKSQYSNLKKELNDSFFNIIDSEEKAYWLGFISADGTINNYKRGSYGFKLSLQESDSDFLQKFLNSISAKFDMKHTKTLKYGKIYYGCEVSFRSKEFVEGLLQYISYNKTLKMSIPRNINNKYIRHYIRGFIDGDGCFYINKNNENKKNLEIVAYDETILIDIQNELIRNDIISKIYTRQNGNKKLGVYANKSLVELYHYLYDGATIFMERKHEKSLKILKLAA